MDLAVYQAFRLLQEVAVVRAKHACARMQNKRQPALLTIRWEAEEAACQLARCERELTLSQAKLSGMQCSELRIARALFLRMLLGSARTRLGRWDMECTSPDAPRSCRFEGVANLLEEQELADIENAMTVLETALYAQMSPPSDSSDST